MRISGGDAMTTDGAGQLAINLQAPGAARVEFCSDSTTLPGRRGDACLASSRSGKGKRMRADRGNDRGDCGELSAVVGAVGTEKVRVVVGDDHPRFSDGVVRALASSGAVGVVAEAGDGATALALINPHRPDVALLNSRMPGLDGAQVAAACCFCQRTTSR
jgi:hypothetical protein